MLLHLLDNFISLCDLREDMPASLNDVCINRAMFEIIVAVKRLFNSCKTRAIGRVNSLAVTSDSRSLSRLRGQRFPPAKPWSFVIRDICIPSRSLH